MIGIYKITSPSNKVYIGQSWNIENRWDRYRRKLCEKQRTLYNSFIKYGVECHTFEILQELPKDITQEVLDQLEIVYIEQYRECRYKMMNIREGGSKGKHSKETLKLISEKVKNRKPLSEEGRRKISEANKGRTVSKETREKIREKLTGKKLSEEHRKKLSEKKKGWKMSSEHKEKNAERLRKITQSEEFKKMVSIINSGKKRSKETCEKIGAVHRGRKHTEEAKRKMSESSKGMKIHTDEHKTFLAQEINNRMVSKVVLECAKCGYTTTNKGTYTQYHGDNCGKKRVMSEQWKENMSKAAIKRHSKDKI